jgi:hypothetical protein
MHHMLSLACFLHRGFNEDILIESFEEISLYLTFGDDSDLEDVSDSSGCEHEAFAENLGY